MTFRRLKRLLRRYKYVIGKVAAVILVVIAIIFAVRYFSSCGTGEDSTASLTEKTRVEVNGKWYELRDDVNSILLIGIDKYAKDAVPDENTNLTKQQCDFLALLVFDSTSKSYNLVHINRDTMTEVQEVGLNSELIGTNIEQICLAHTYGTGGKDSCRNTVKAVENLFYDVSIIDYVAFTMDAVPVVNDAVGGVTVHIEDDFSGTEPTFVKGTDVTLKGDKALTFVRSRMSMVDDPTNTARMKRQRTYLSALRDAAKVKMQESDTWAAETLLSVSEYVTTNYSQSDLGKLADALVNYKQSDIITIEGEATSRIYEDGDEYAEFYVDEASLQELVLKLFYTPVSGN